MIKKEEKEAAIIDVLADVRGEVVDPIPTDTNDSVILLDTQSLCSCSHFDPNDEIKWVKMLIVIRHSSETVAIDVHFIFERDICH